MLKLEIFVQLRYFKQKKMAINKNNSLKTSELLCDRDRIRTKFQILFIYRLSLILSNYVDRIVYLQFDFQSYCKDKHFKRVKLTKHY